MPRLGIFLNRSWWYVVTILPTFLFVLWSPPDTKLCGEYIVFLVCYVFSNQTGPFCTHVKNVSNTCPAKTYYINRPTHKNCKSVNPSFSTGQETNELRYCSHLSVALMAGDVTHDCFWHSEDNNGTSSKSENNERCLCQYNFSCNNGKRLVLSYSMCHLFRLWLGPSTHSYRIDFCAHNMNTRLQQ